MCPGAKLLRQHLNTHNTTSKTHNTHTPHPPTARVCLRIQPTHVQHIYVHTHTHTHTLPASLWLRLLDLVLVRGKHLFLVGTAQVSGFWILKSLSLGGHKETGSGASEPARKAEPSANQEGGPKCDLSVYVCECHSFTPRRFAKCPLHARPCSVHSPGTHGGQARLSCPRGVTTQVETDGEHADMCLMLLVTVSRP